MSDYNFNSEIADESYKLMQHLPNNYEQSLEMLMKQRHMTEEDLAYNSGLSVKTISRHRVMGTRNNPKMTTVIQIIIGLKLQPPLSTHLLNQAGYVLNNTKEHEVYRYLLNTSYNKGVDFWNKELERNHMKKLA